MDDNKHENEPTQEYCASKIRLFDVWKEYEGIAMHFNDLLIRLRMQALGGVAAISALVGFLSQGEAPEDLRWGVMTGVFAILVLFWVAIWFLDFQYYNRLLLGAVAAILKLEEISATKMHISHLQLSQIVEGAMHGDLDGVEGPGFWSGRHWFYILVLIGLLGGMWFSGAEYCLSALPDGIGHSHGLCHLTNHWI